MNMIRLLFPTYIIANVSLVLYGLLALAKPDILLEAFLSHIYQFPAGAIRATGYLAALFRLIGYFNLIIGALGLLILQRYRSTGHQWNLRTAIASTIFAYIGPIVFDNTVGSIGFFEIVEHILFGFVIVTGIVSWNTRSQNEH